MNPLRRHLRLLNRLALLAALALALVPSISRALALSQAPQTMWAQICTMQGVQWVGIEAAPSPEAEWPGSHLAADDQCPYCPLAGAGIAPLRALPLAHLPAPGSQAQPVLFLQAPRTLFAWATAQPRGPPHSV